MRNTNDNTTLRTLVRYTLRLASILLIVAGVGLAAASALIEADFATALLGGVTIAIPLVAALETVKVGQFLFAGALWSRFGVTEKTVSVILHVLLVGISFGASTTVFTDAVNSPNREEVIAQEIARVDSLYQARITRVRDEAAPKIARYDSLLVAEEDVQRRDRTFRGPRFNELMGLKDEAINERNARIKTLQQEREQRIQEIRNASYADDRRAQNSLVASLLSAVKAVFGHQPGYLPAGFLIAIIIAAAMECGIFAATRLTARMFADEVDAIIATFSTDRREPESYEERLDRDFERVDEAISRAVDTLKQNPAATSFEDLVEAVEGGFDGKT